MSIKNCIVYMEMMICIFAVYKKKKKQQILQELKPV